MSVIKMQTVSRPEVQTHIEIGAGLWGRVRDALEQNLTGHMPRRFFLIADEALPEKRLAALKDQINVAGQILVKGGDGNKSFQQLQTVCESLAQAGIRRDDAVLAAGGGVTGDLAGMAAGIMLRGIPVVQLPTTLLAMADSAVGGKTGVNLAAGKNLAGVFHHPAAVLMDPEILETLPDREWRAGYAEIVKAGLIKDGEFFELLEANHHSALKDDIKLLQHIIERAVKIKVGIVQDDPCETSGQRVLLNLGHSFGHAIEAAYAYDGRVLHGEAVAVGLVLAAELSCDIVSMSRRDVARIRDHLATAGLPTELSDLPEGETLDLSNLVRLMRTDKKSDWEGMNFITLAQPGQARLSRNIPQEKILDVLNRNLKSKDKYG